MYNFVIDTDSEKLSSVSIYTDKEKTKRLAAPLDAVGRFAQSVKVAFIGSRKPTAADTLRLVVSWDGLVDNILQSSDSEALRAYIAQAGTPDVSEPDTWTFPVRFESAALEAALAQRSKITLRGAVVVENEAAGTHVEYHFAVGAVASIFAGAAADPQTAPIEFARVKRLSWAEYQALETPESNVLYYVEDAPSETTQHAEDPGAHQALFDASRAAAEARAQSLERAIPLLETVPVAGDNNADAFGYLGTLRALGAFGDAVDVRRLCVYSRSSGTIASGSIAVWARILKIENDTWTVAAQSENSVKWNDYGLNAEIPFEMVPVAGITPPNADEAVAIVFVNDPAAAAGTSNGRLSFRTVSLHGGLQHALNAPDNLNAGQAWSPRMKLRFAPLAGTQIHATQESLETLADATTQALASVQQWLNNLEARIAALEG